MPAIPLIILYEDNHLLAVDKPPGLLVQGDATGDETLLERAAAFVKARDRKPGNVFVAAAHRLDRPVSGVVLLAKTSKAAKRLADAFRTRRVAKTYLAVVHGTPAGPGATLSGWIVKDTARNTSRMVPEGTPGAKTAILHYRVVASTGERSLLEVALETGRSHQIRVQLSHAGHPVVGDLRYGSSEALGEAIALHHTRLEVLHPVGGRPMVFEASPSGPLANLFEGMGRAG